MTDILQAARSYYGLSDTESCTTQLFTNQAGQACVAFEIPLSPADFLAIAERMEAMQEAESQSDIVPLDIEMPDMKALRAVYEKLSKAEKGRYGSFSNYLRERSHAIIEVRDSASPAAQRVMDKALEQAEWSLNERIGWQSEQIGIGDRKVAHIDAPETEIPMRDYDAVWLYDSECSPAQKQHSTDYESKGNRWLVSWAMLTEEQRQKAKEARP